MNSQEGVSVPPSILDFCIKLREMREIQVASLHKWLKFVSLDRGGLHISFPSQRKYQSVLHFQIFDHCVTYIPSHKIIQQAGILAKKSVTKCTAKFNTNIDYIPINNIFEVNFLSIEQGPTALTFPAFSTFSTFIHDEENHTIEMMTKSSLTFPKRKYLSG